MGLGTRLVIINYGQSCKPWLHDVHLHSGAQRECSLLSESQPAPPPPRPPGCGVRGGAPVVAVDSRLGRSGMQEDLSVLAERLEACIPRRIRTSLQLY